MSSPKTRFGKIIAPILITLVVVLAAGGYLVILAMARLPIWAFLLVGSVYLCVIVCIVIALVQRIHEIKGGEEDEAVHY